MNREAVRNALAPAYLFWCLLLGGSAQGVWGAAILQLAAILIIAWSFMTNLESSVPVHARRLGWLLMTAAALFVLQTLPLPPSLWTRLPGRDFIVQGQAILGLPSGWSSVSLAPYDTLAAILALLPPAAMLCSIFRLRAYTPTGLAVAILLATVAGVALGALQTSGGGEPQSPWYPYAISNFGVATGFFANSNHMASLLLVAIPFTVALAAHGRGGKKDERKRHMLSVLGVASVGVILIGIVLNGSLTGYGLVIPVTVASLLIAFPLNRPQRMTAMGFSATALIGFLVILFSPLSERLPDGGAATSLATRQAMLGGATTVAREFFPAGTGLGTFPAVFPLSEDPARVESIFVNHVHNDYVELALETGISGIVLMLLFLLWWAVAVRRMLQSPAADGFALAGAIGSASILVHSAVDYPLRTSAMAAVFAVCLALILVSRRTAVSDRDIRPTRHLVID